MISGCLIGIFNIIVILLGFGVAFGGFWLTNHNVNTFPDVVVPPSTAVIPPQFAQYVPEFTVDTSSILNSAINGAALGITISGIVVFAFGIWGFIAFCCKIRCMAWIYIIFLLCILAVQLVWGIASVLAYNRDPKEFPLFDSQIKSDINGLFTGAGISGYDITTNGEFYCMVIPGQTGTAWYPFPGYYTYEFVDSINSADIQNLDKCTAPNGIDDCAVLSNECEDNITLWLIRQVYYAGLLTLILACVTLVIAILCMYSLHKMNDKKRARNVA